ncbi:hypothetical protein FHW37_11524 [Neorhizobium alkalisoli]|uniref:Uncharacterized protein n=2 Tax=Neorhizobium alkalisoli TaxID=528178 RepID=A0A561Q7K5_9HYPH|nr:hypothetical protein FHW37_11524 [Neorhizobium alkalisoli]
MHIGGGNPGVWGAGGKGDNAPAWLKNAYYNTTDATDPQMVAAKTESASAPSTNPLYNSAQASAGPTATPPAPDEKSHNGILVQAFNKLTGNDVQVPGSILGADTDKLAKGFAGIGDFAKALSADTDSINSQIARGAARAQAGRNDQPVELTFLDFAAERKKKKGGISGLGGYFV